MTAQSVLVAAETKLLKAQRAYARKVLGLLVDHLHHHHPRAVRLSVYADQRIHEYLLGELLDHDGDAMDFDPNSVVVPHAKTDGPFGEPLCWGPYSAAELLHRALSTYEGPLAKLLRIERHTGVHYLDLTRAP
jgi:hypothetical protein